MQKEFSVLIYVIIIWTLTGKVLLKMAFNECVLAAAEGERTPEEVERLLKSRATFEDMGIRLLDSLIKLGEMEIVKAQVKLAQKVNPEKVTLSFKCMFHVLVQTV
jgi:hypothetical protein